MCHTLNKTGNSKDNFKTAMVTENTMQILDLVSVMAYFRWKIIKALFIVRKILRYRILLTKNFFFFLNETNFSFFEFNIHFCDIKTELAYIIYGLSVHQLQMPISLGKIVIKILSMVFFAFLYNDLIKKNQIGCVLVLLKVEEVCNYFFFTF